MWLKLDAGFPLKQKWDEVLDLNYEYFPIFSSLKSLRTNAYHLAPNMVFNLHSFVSVLKNLYWTVLQDFYVLLSWEPQYENMYVLHVLVLTLELSDFWPWRLGWFNHWDQMRNACRKVELTVHLKMQRRVKIAPLVLLHALVRSNKRKFMQIHP